MTSVIRLVLLAVAAVSLGACNTSGAGRETASPYLGDVDVDSLAEAHHFGRRLTHYYADGYEDANARRRWFNVGIWAATTYTAGAAGLGAHADNIFVGALTGTALSDLEPIVNEGGPEAWIHGLGKTVCLSRAAYTGLDPLTMRAVAILEGREADQSASPREREALGVYRGTYMAVMNGYDQAYSEFLTRRVGEPISTSALAEMANGARGDAQSDQPAPVEPATTQEPVATASSALEAQVALLSQTDRSLAAQIVAGGLLVQSPGEQPQAFAMLAEAEAQAVASGEQAIVTPQFTITRRPEPGGSIPLAQEISPALRAALLQAFAQLRRTEAQASLAANQAAAEAAARLETANAMLARQINFCLASPAS